MVDRFDREVDALLEKVRGTPSIDRVMTAATHAGEFSAVWHAASLARGLAKGRRDQVVALAIGIGLESLIVNQGLKRLFRRQRPTVDGDDRFDIRSPMTSSFPSGHASAAAFAATTLIGWDGARSVPLWGAMATTVAISRPYVRIHHASDVVAGAAVGAAMGLVARQVFKRTGVG
jgi:membrane-associated phospholipid phosphatase